MRILWISILIVLLDQASKAAVVRTMHRGESIPIVGDWLRFTFTENPGMAFGLQLFSRQSMAMLAIVVTVVLLWYLFTVRGGYAPYLASLALVLGGAVGNVIDRAFYGLILGYGDFLQGKVVDFIHVDAWRGYLPEALPWIGGMYLPLFPIWNVADMAIVVGVVGLLTFQRRFHELAFEAPKRERERLRQLERERDEAETQKQASPEGTPGAAATQASPASSEVPPRTPSAENAGASSEAALEDDEPSGNGDGSASEEFAPVSSEEPPADSTADGKKTETDRSPVSESKTSPSSESRPTKEERT